MKDLKEFFADLIIDWNETPWYEKALFGIFIIFITGIFVYSC
jgi:hypothetical protein